eukprot:TRINITY_DN39425_c0_g1_i1.p1 TRINITY_DN39425_c0_g1~~TRINITY_DN39425_c0_g1_i1.p1  ORF type:complete len:309 (+),score=107.51 TRINITY_DN39425_c0_g1_i1:145-1071(+)
MSRYSRLREDEGEEGDETDVGEDLESGLESGALGEMEMSLQEDSAVESDGLLGSQNGEVGRSDSMETDSSTSSRRSGAGRQGRTDSSGSNGGGGNSLKEDGDDDENEEGESHPWKYVVVDPDGSIWFAVDNENAPTAPPSPPPRRAQVLGAVGPDGMDEDMEGVISEINEYILHLRRKRSFAFLLGMDSVFVILSLIYIMTHDWNLALALLVLAGLGVNATGMAGAVKESIGYMSFFVIGETIIVGMSGAIAFSPIFILRLLILILGFQLRASIRFVKDWEEEHGEPFEEYFERFIEQEFHGDPAFFV